MENKKRMSKTSLIGLLIILMSPVIYFVLWVLLASIIGESKLEGPESIENLGLILFGIPLIIGLLLIVSDLIFNIDITKRVNSNMRWIISIIGLICLSVGLFGLFSTPQGDPNIGSPILIMLGVVLLVFGFAGLLKAPKNSKLNKGD